MSVPIARRPWSVLVLAVLAAAAGCDADPIGSDAHPVPVEVRVASAGVYFANATELSAFGRIVRELGVPEELTVEFFNEDGSPYALAGDQYLEVVFDDGGVAGWEVESQGDFTGTFEGLAEGTTRVRFRLMHGDVGSSTAHLDFMSAKIDVEIVP